MPHSNCLLMYYFVLVNKWFLLMIAVEGDDVKRLSTTLNTIFHEKQRQQKVSHPCGGIDMGNALSVISFTSTKSVKPGVKKILDITNT